MKKIFFAIIAVSLLAGACSAENLMTALPIGKDNLAIQGFYSSTDINVAEFQHHAVRAQDHIRADR